MNTPLEKVLDFSNYRKTLTNQLNALRIKKDADLNIFYGGGAFVVTRELMTFVSMVSNTRGAKTPVVLLDANDNPIEVIPEEFLLELTDTYFRATSEYHNEYERIRKARDVQSILDLDE